MSNKRQSRKIGLSLVATEDNLVIGIINARNGQQSRFIGSKKLARVVARKGLDKGGFSGRQYRKIIRQIESSPLDEVNDHFDRFLRKETVYRIMENLGLIKRWIEFNNARIPIMNHREGSPLAVCVC